MLYPHYGLLTESLIFATGSVLHLCFCDVLLR